jgi:multiple sugar transport system substrate-binding protein
MLLSLGKGEWTVFCWLPFLYSAGGHLVDQGRPDLMTEGAIATLNFAATLVQDQSVMLSAPERGYDLDPFLTGNVAMQITGPWVLPQLRTAGIDFDVFPFPVAVKPAAVLGGENFFLCRTSPAKTQAAQVFLDYILSPAFQLPWALQTGYLPVNQTLLTQPDYQNFVAANPSLQVFIDQMAVARSRPILPKYAALSENFGRAIEATLLGRSPDAALQTAQQKIDRIFDRS